MNKITAKFQIEAAHKLIASYNQDCKNNIHGHSYKLYVSLRREGPLNDGMVIDFKRFKEIINDNLINKYDHSLILYKDDPLVERVKEYVSKLVLYNDNPTAENMASIMLYEIKNTLKKYISRDFCKYFFVSLKLYETEDNFVETGEIDLFNDIMEEANSND